MKVQFEYGGMNLIRTYDPRYDTLVLDPSRNGKVVDENLFVSPLRDKDVYPGKVRHYSDTNMTCAGCLGHPLHAQFDWMRVFVDSFDISDDLNWLKRHCSFRMVMGGDTTVRTLSLDAMSPVIPKGSDDSLKKMIEDGKVGLWPWFHALLPKLQLEPTESFRVHVTSDEIASLKSPLRVKVLLGPWLYRQEHDRPRMEERPEEPVDPE